MIKPNEDLYAEKIEMCACELSKESMIFLLNKDYARGTLCINGRIVFNYKYMHLFFIFFFMPYANNVGRYWKSERLRKHELQSISDISIFKCLYKQMPELEKYLELDLDKYFD